MHYLEDDLELLEGVPEELKQQCFEMRDLDGRVEKSLADAREESRQFFNVINQLNPEERERRCAKIRETYKSIREMSEEKLAIAEYLNLMLEKYQERITRDLTEFKYELEADTAGVTDGIEKELRESIKSASASRKGARPVLGNIMEVSEHDSNFKDITPQIDLSASQNPSANVYRMNGHRNPASSLDSHSQSAERRTGTGEEFCISSQQNSSSVGRQLTMRRSMAVGNSCSRTSLDETSSAQEFLPPKKRAPRSSNISPMPFGQSQEQALDSFGIRKTSHPCQRYSPAPLPVSPAGSSSASASRQPPRFNYPNSGTISGAVIVGRSGGGHSTRTLIGQPSGEVSQKICSGSSTNSESTYQHHLVQPTQPPFSAQGESQSSYGRPVKLTSRVQQMLKDRQIQGHRVGRPSGSLYSASSSSSSAYNSGSYGQSSRYSSQHNDVGELSEEEGRQLYAQDQRYLDEEADEEDVEALGEEDEEADEDSEDQDNRVWCTCQQKSEGDMVACDNKTCPYEWFHYSCVGITAPPKGKWFCPTCVKKMRRSQSTENH